MATDAENQARMVRITRNLTALAERRGLNPIYIEELTERAEKGDVLYFLRGTDYFFAALEEVRSGPSTPKSAAPASLTSP